ncbi:hypothetical protein CC85DRAFT_284594 [Cutaneotrichosporon oleaginosum]|uniref:Uncharacterized protein n=1 Tax=Cutaneotrichosporon oleaginosum TaxID=879819 RepID=A0A0J1B6V8_9TREE|nr:uncharacterized protein CC85DRAFT_284594 [Cutaneotrichosporon oleaginosum]KLT43454.1 hypothetical protein CC85DRAFT_284594 [Cutaneotrichosporon oleaginosum]TXT05333.1 hypothetical protein COLE_06653 [Cutaneotrichosporon oleaginosum]
MSSYDATIDPALRDLPPPPPAAGVKRKIRAANASPVPIPQDRGRVTRRSAAALLSAAQQLHSATSPSSDKALSAPDLEPSRGEEENKYQWTPRDSAKRSRHRSPSSHAGGGGGGHAPAPPRVNNWTAALAAGSPNLSPTSAPPQGTGGPSSSLHSPTLGGIDNLAAAAATFQPNPPRQQLPYPYGLTPFRYPCLTPHLPQPPPGDPTNPAFIAFDPSHASQRSTTTSPSDSSRSNGHMAPMPGSMPASRPSSRGRDDHFASFSTLLAASEAHSTQQSIAGSHPPSYYPTPERDLGGR